MVLELDIGIICGCLSSVKPVMNVLFPALFGSSQHSQNGEGTRATAFGHATTRQSFMFKALSEVSSNQGGHVSMTDIEAQSQHSHEAHEQKQDFAFATVETVEIQSDVPGSMPPDPTCPQNSNNMGQEAARREFQADSQSKHLSGESEEWMIQRDRRRSAVEKNGTSDAASEEWILPGNRRRSFA